MRFLLLGVYLPYLSTKNTTESEFQAFNREEMRTMKCKCCHNEVERTDLYCRFCGSQLYKSQKKEIAVPKPRKLANGSYSAQLMVNGERCTVNAPTLEEYEVKARAVKLELLEMKKAPPKVTLGDAVSNYIEVNSNVLSPSTIRGYTMIRENRFKGYMDKPYSEIDYQQMINDEIKLAKPKTITNAFALVKTSLKVYRFDLPEVNLPTVIVPDLPFLDYEQIPLFLKAIKDQPGELASILALHSLRMSELLAITINDIVINNNINNTYVVVDKALVRDINNQYIEKTTKTEKSTRMIPVMIPRLLEILPTEGRLVTNTPVGIERQIARACDRAGLPHVRCHDLRRSFASLAFHLKWDERSIMTVGGWSNMQTVHKVYIKLAQQDLIANTESMSDFYRITSEACKPLV